MQRHVSKIVLCVEVDVTFTKEKCVVHNVDNLDVSEIASQMELSVSNISSCLKELLIQLQIFL